jgi:hypothetical protein
VDGWLDGPGTALEASVGDATRIPAGEIGPDADEKTRGVVIQTPRVFPVMAVSLIPPDPGLQPWAVLAPSQVADVDGISRDRVRFDLIGVDH